MINEEGKQGYQELKLIPIFYFYVPSASFHFITSIAILRKRAKIMLPELLSISCLFFFLSLTLLYLPFHPLIFFYFAVGTI